MCADQQRGLRVFGRPSRRRFDAENIGVGLTQGSKRLAARRPSVFGKPCRQILGSLIECVGSGLRVAFSDQGPEMAENAGPTVGQGKVAVLRRNFGTDASAREYLEENGMRYSTVDNVGLAHSLFQGIQTRVYFWQHALGYRAFLDHPLDVLARDGGQMASLGIADALDIRHHDKLFRVQSSGDRSGHEVSVDIVGIALPVGPDRSDDRNIVVALQLKQEAGIDLLDISYETEIALGVIFVEIPFQTFRPRPHRQGLRQDQPSVLPAETDGAPAVAVDKIRDLHVDFARQHHLNNFHGRFVRDAHAVQKFRFDAEAVEHLVDLRAPTMDDDGIEADVLQQDDVLRESLLQRSLGHRAAAVLDHNGLAAERTDVRQGFDEYVGFPNELVQRRLPRESITPLPGATIARWGT